MRTNPASVPFLVAIPAALVLFLIAHTMSSSTDVSRAAASYPAAWAPASIRDAAGAERPSASPTPLARAPAEAREAGAPAAAPARALGGPIARGHGCVGPMCSVGKLAPYHAGDLEAPGELERAVRARAFNGELVLTYANMGGSPWVTNLALSLRDVGIEHFLLIMMERASCDGLFASAAALSCGWSSWDLDGCKSEADKVGAVERMWFIRHHYLARIIELGGVNVMALDGDMTINKMPYAALHAPATLGAHNFVLSLDNGPSAKMINNGFMYLRGCVPGGQTHRILAEILQRERDVCRRPEVYGRHGPYWRATDARNVTSGSHGYVFVSAKDQKIYQDVLMSAFCGRHMIVRNEPTQVKIEKWREYVAHFTGGLTVAEHEACAYFQQHFNNGRDKQAGWSHFSHALRLPPRPAGGGIVGLDLIGLPAGPPPARVAGDDESAAAPNASFISSWHGTMEGELAGWDGHWAHEPPIISHFVGGLDKIDAMQSLGWWRFETEVVIASLPRGASGAPPAVGAVEPQMQRHFASGLPRVLALAGPGASGTWPSFRVSIRAQAAMRAWLSTVASALGRVAVEPVTDCRSPWIVRLNNSNFGFQRRRGRYPREGLFAQYDEKTGVGAFVGDCAAGFSPSEPAARPGACCFPFFCKTIRRRHGVHGLPGAHHALAEAKLAEPGSTRLDLDWAALGLPADGVVSAARLVEALGASGGAAAGASVLVLRVGTAMRWPRVSGLNATARASLCADFGARCGRFVPAETPAEPLPVLPADWRAALAADREGGALDEDSHVAGWLREHAPGDMFAWRRRHWRELPPGETI